MYRRIAVIFPALVVLGLFEGFLTTFRLPEMWIVVFALSYGLLTGAIIIYGSRAATYPITSSRISAIPRSSVVLLATTVTVAIAFGVLQAFPDSADEFGYTYLADTLRHHRLWNPSFPPELHDVVKTIYIPDQDGKRLSQYPPGWPAILAMFPTLMSSALANPLIGLGSGILLILALKELKTSVSVTISLLIIALLAPFTLYNNASFFNHSLSGMCLLAVAVFDLREQRVRSIWHQLGIGFAFSVLLTTRYEVFMIAFLLYGLDGLLRRRVAFIKASVFAAVAALPVVVLFGYYNWRITGSPLTTTLAWGAPEIHYGLYASGVEGVPNTPVRALMLTGRLVLRWAEFAGFAILPFFAVALWRRVTARTIRWFDLMLPAIVLFFVFYPDGGGFQFGPRYWYAGWVLLPLTLATGFASGEPWRFNRWVVDPTRLSVLQGAAYIGFTIGYAVFAYQQVSVRQVPLRVAATAPQPAVVLIATDVIRYVPWQIRTIPFEATDYTRNGPEGLGPVVLARDMGAERTALLCRQFSDRTVWRLEFEGAPPVGQLKRAC